MGASPTRRAAARVASKTSLVVASSGLHSCWLGEWWYGFFGARHFLADEPLKAGEIIDVTVVNKRPGRFSKSKSELKLARFRSLKYRASVLLRTSVGGENHSVY
jgi:hypothetical protein